MSRTFQRIVSCLIVAAATPSIGAPYGAEWIGPDGFALQSYYQSAVPSVFDADMDSHPEVILNNEGSLRVYEWSSSGPSILWEHSPSSPTYAGEVQFHDVDVDGTNEAWVIYGNGTGSTWLKVWDWTTDTPELELLDVVSFPTFDDWDGDGNEEAIVTRWNATKTAMHVEIWGTDAVSAVGGSPQVPTSRLVSSPNPASGAVTFTFNASASGLGTLSVYDVAGHEVSREANISYRAGMNSWEWDGLTKGGTRCVSGVYYGVVTTRSGTIKTKMTVVR